MDFASSIRAAKNRTRWIGIVANSFKRKYVTRPGIEPRIFGLRVRCPTDCAMRPGTGHSERKKKKRQPEDEVGRQYQRVD